MKKSKFLAAVMAVALVLLPLGVNTIEASAAEPRTYAVKFLEEHGWRIQEGTSTFDENAYHRELYILQTEIRDGDYVVVYNECDQAFALDLGDKKLGNLTIVQTVSPLVIYTGGVDEFYGLANTSAAINGDVNTATVYDDLVCNFNGNVGTLNIYIKGEINSTLGVGGTLGHFYGYHLDEERVYYDFYNFKPASLAFYDGGFRTTDDNYTRTVTPVQNPVNMGTAAPATPAPSGPAASDNDYDDVPKTGESSMAMWLLFAAALCAGGSYILGKKAQ